ncbi:MAG: CidA/LrgA family protein, partial [Oribacterium sp.]|nr:CidA/LrgA family protein [Oribacterium sp.]
MNYLKEIMWIAAFTFVGEVLNNLLPLPVPAGVYGMLLLLFALMIGIVKLLMDNLAAVLASITAGTVSSLLSILLMGKLFGLSNEHITT